MNDTTTTTNDQAGPELQALAQLFSSREKLRFIQAFITGQGGVPDAEDLANAMEAIEEACMALDVLLRA